MISVQDILQFFSNHQRAYQLTYSRTSPAAQYVLSDMAEFCYADKTIAKPGLSEFELGVREGRRQVWLRTNRALHLTPEEQFDLVKQRKDKAHA